ncbi:MAG TPA: HAD-IB family phosphatase [Candidatus Acidoferrales bacterium]|nr:HAD-IB family phosphatase [Candidatus Acidoferrales bacterium]
MSHNGGSGAALFMDFDGTILDVDTAQIALNRFGDPNWMRIEQALERGEVSFEESLKQEFATLKAPPKMIIEEVSRLATLRPNFDRLVEYCKRTHLPLKVVSGGLDFCIRHFLDRGGWLSFVTIYAPESHFTGGGYTLSFPEVTESSTNFKDGLVRLEKANGRRVFFVGNGFGDLPAAKEATFAFAIRGSRLAELCQKQRVQHEEIDDFEQIVNTLSYRFLETP